MLNVNSQHKTREYGFDNIRFVLIISVVFAHLLGVAGLGGLGGFLGKLIYSFHMPVFIFLFGYFVKFKPTRIVCSWVIPYAVFQTLYILFEKFVLGADTRLQYTTPYWLMWYMVACIFYQLLIPMYDTDSPRGQKITLAVLFVLSLAVGYDKSAAYYVAISRFFVFQPWFVLGLYCKKAVVNGNFNLRKPQSPVMIALISVAVLVLSACISLSDITVDMLYGAYPYISLGYSAVTRGFTAIVAFSWLAFLILVIKPLLDKKIPVITTVGQNTLSVYLLHGFVAKAIPKFAPFLTCSTMVAFITSITLVLLFGNPYVGKVFKTAFSDSWLHK